MITQSPKTVWTTHYDLAEADGEKARRKYPFDASRLPMPAPEYLIEVELATQDLVVRGKKLKYVDVVSPEEFGLPRHRIRLGNCWGKRIWGLFWQSEAEAMRYFRIVGIRPAGRSRDYLQAVLNNDLPEQEDRIMCTLGYDEEDIAHHSGRDRDMDDIECYTFAVAPGCPLDELIQRNRRRWGG